MDVIISQSLDVIRWPPFEAQFPSHFADRGSVIFHSEMLIDHPRHHAVSDSRVNQPIIFNEILNP
jgi:hypothetical protein